MTEQDRLVHAMAEDLEGIARHFGQVKDALQVEDDGGFINMDDIRSKAVVGLSGSVDLRVMR
jgi:hypothetical protein